jgi:hypothetical protein
MQENPDSPSIEQSAPVSREQSTHSAAHHRLVVRIYVAIIGVSLPATAATLVLLHTANPVPNHPDMSGLTATSIGIIGIIIFYIFLYKLQMSVAWTPKDRFAWLVAHVVTIVGLFYLVIWFGFASPWSAVAVWGDYDLQTTARSWVISVIVAGTITLLGSLFDLIRRLTFSRMGKR